MFGLKGRRNLDIQETEIQKVLIFRDNNLGSYFLTNIVINIHTQVLSSIEKQ